MERRAFLLGVGSVALSGSLWQGACGAEPARPGPSPYGPLTAPDGNGFALPSGFTSRVIARSGEPVMGYAWHGAPDGGACYEAGDGWIYVSNSELDGADGGASAIRFGPDGSIERAYRILARTSRNCAGGATPWRTWLSCEEIGRGSVFETDPYGGNPGVRRSAMGRFRHEAAACDPHRKVVYLTEDEPDGCFYRFRPARWHDLSRGVLEVFTKDSRWQPIPDPAAEADYTRDQVPSARRFNGGEGCCYADGVCWFTTKGDNKVWAYDAVNGRLDVAYDAEAVPHAPLNGVDNIIRTRRGELFVAEDGGNMEINVITPASQVAPFLRLGGHGESELTGPAFSPDGTRLYFSSQRGTTGMSAHGITYEVRGPFHR